MAPKPIAELFGLSEEFVRAACARKVDPCPCVDVGNGMRRHYRIRPSVFEEWYRKEELRA